ncbi:MAG: ribosomal-protein-alanine N-acetyltransferase [Ruminococcaceae bacterium]|nr:ribosomal-protein-alanine N-acetyltransferase [Oscillospiraceae bacterium]
MTQKPLLRAVRLCPEHIAGAAELEALCFAEPWSKKALGMLCTEGHVGVAVLTVPDGRVVAYGGMMTVLDEGQILNVATSPLYRRMGCAKLVMRFLCEYADTHRLSTLSLEVRASNTAAISLYEACGFLRVGVRRGFYKNPVEDAYVMLRQSPSANHHF